MKIPIILIFLVIISCSEAASLPSQKFLNCLSQEFKNYSSISNDVYTPNNSSYSSILQFSIQNLRFASNSTPKPLVIITPEHESQIPPVIYCSKNSGLQVRTRSGGHDYEGLSSLSPVPFVILDLINLSKITIDVARKTAWVGSGATIGSLYYRIAEKSPTLGFPAGVCPTIGIGGHFSGGGYGMLMRKYGLAADNVIDARIIDVNGKFLDRKSMGEDLFWAIRGGGGASFGVIVGWKVKLVDVPERVTFFNLRRTMEQNATQLVHRWQNVAPQLDKELTVGVIATMVNSGKEKSVNVFFYSLYLGGVDGLLPLMKKRFPELGLVREDCIEGSWIQSILFIAGFPYNSSTEVLLNRTQRRVQFLKGKSNYVQMPIPEHGFQGMWREFNKPGGEAAQLIIAPYGGRMAEISDSATPFPHRAGNLYKIQHLVIWDEARDSDLYINWSRKMQKYLTPYVSRSPRGAYLNYRDLDIGVNNVVGNTCYAQASVWGKKYFNNNFHRLVRVKTVVDPDNFFRNEQSIPPLY